MWVRARVQGYPWKGINADIVLVMLGTNDIWHQNATVPVMRARMHSLLTRVFATMPKTDVYLASITAMTGPPCRRRRGARVDGQRARGAHAGGGRGHRGELFPSDECRGWPLPSHHVIRAIRCSGSASYRSPR